MSEKPGNKVLKMKGTGNIGNQDFDFREQANIIQLFYACLGNSQNC